MDTTVRNAKMLVMHAEGMTYQGIGDTFGISRQRAEQIISQQYRKTGERRRRVTDLDKIVYPAVREYFEENVRVGYTSFSKKVFGYYNVNSSKKLIRLFQGREALMTVTQIKQICAEIGKPFEEVFARDDNKTGGSVVNEE